MGKPTTKPTTTIVELAVWEISNENGMRKYDGVNSKAIVEKRVSWYVLRFFDTWNEQVTGERTTQHREAKKCLRCLLCYT